MKVIGAGAPRTATLSQKVALEMLGFGPCYHMVNVLADLSLVALWSKALDGSPDWEQTLGGFQSTVDWPGGFFYRELMEAYPDAKVMLSVRDPEAWERSMRATVWDVWHGASLMAHLSDARKLIDPAWRDYAALMERLLFKAPGTFAGRPQEPQSLIDAFNAHTEAVRNTVPADRLLVWQASDGWEPLCEFLEVDVPDVPFPRLNDSGTFTDRVVGGCLGVLQEWWAQQQREQELAPAAQR